MHCLLWEDELTKYARKKKKTFYSIIENTILCEAEIWQLNRNIRARLIIVE